jgi:hypothetical protein
LKYFLVNTKCIKHSGELCCNATKVERNENKLLCDDNDDKKPVLGRKIDLLLNAASMDISSSEWKKDGVSASLVEQQQIKNVRTNSAILRQLHKLPIDEERKPNVYVLAMDWIGKSFKLCTKQHYCNITDFRCLWLYLCCERDK